MNEFSYLQSMQEFCVTQSKEFKSNNENLMSIFWKNAAEGFKQRAENLSIEQAEYKGI